MKHPVTYNQTLEDPWQRILNENTGDIKESELQDRVIKSVAVISIAAALSAIPKPAAAVIEGIDNSPTTTQQVSHEGVDTITEDATLMNVQLISSLKPTQTKRPLFSNLDLKAVAADNQDQNILPTTQESRNDTAIVEKNSPNIKKLPDNIPQEWRELIDKVAPQYPTTDPRLVAASLFVENRAWPAIDKNWDVSKVGAAGPWQFIPSSWATMGRDGDGDGKVERNNPKDAVHAAFIHHEGSAGLPIADGYDENLTPEENFRKVTFRRDGKNLLSFMSKYNGSGAPSGKKLSEFQRGENSDYVKMSFILLASDFQQKYELDPHGRNIGKVQILAAAPTNLNQKISEEQTVLATAPSSANNGSEKKSYSNQLFTGLQPLSSMPTPPAVPKESTTSLFVLPDESGKAKPLASKSNVEEKKPKKPEIKLPELIDVGKHDVYSNGKHIGKRDFAAIPDLESTSQESKVGHKYYIEGSKGLAIAEINAAKQLNKMVQAAEADGIDLRAVSSYRTNEHQKDLWLELGKNTAIVAEPGHSHHQGIEGAIDFDLDGLPIQASFYKTKDGKKPSVDNPRIAPQSKTWLWLKENAPKYGYEQYWNEPWHWAMTGEGHEENQNDEQHEDYPSAEVVTPLHAEEKSKEKKAKENDKDKEKSTQVPLWANVSKVAMYTEKADEATESGTSKQRRQSNEVLVSVAPISEVKPAADKHEAKLASLKLEKDIEAQAVHSKERMNKVGKHVVQVEVIPVAS